MTPRIFKHHIGIIVFFYVLIILSTIAIFSIEINKNIWLFLYAIAFLGIIFYVTPYLLSHKIIINDRMIQDVTTYYGKSIIKELYWHEIGHIVDDYASPILFYPSYKLHVIHIMPQEGIKKSFKYITISSGIKNYKELIHQVLSCLGPGVIIDDYIYKLMDKNNSQHTTHT